MKTNHSLWRRLILTASIAFIIGLVPYLWADVLAPILDTGGVVALVDAFKGSLLFMWERASQYVGTIISLYVVFIAIVIFLEGRNPDRTIAWLLTLALIPGLGLAAYMIMGPDMKRIHNIKLFRPTASFPNISEDMEQNAPSQVQKISTLAYRNSGADILERNVVKTLINGDATFAEIKRALRSAKRYINIEYFIFKNDSLGTEITDILRERAHNGVKVRMIVDGVGSWRLGRKFLSELKKDGIDVHTFMPVSFPAFHSGINYRNHRKIIVVDGCVAFTGGLNVSTVYLGQGKLGFWRDTHARFEGDSVKALNSVFIGDWNFCAQDDLRPDDDFFAPSDEESKNNIPFLPTQIVASGSSSVWHGIQQLFFSMITEAKDRIWITTPYLVPGAAIMNALRVAALSGVDVRLLIPAKSDHFLVYWAGRGNIEDLLRSGVRIWRYRRGFVHAKTLIMDDIISSLGTANLDVRSLEINFEVQAFVYNEGINASLASNFLRDIEDSEEVLLSLWQKRGLGVRCLESLGKLWSSQI